MEFRGEWVSWLAADWCFVVCWSVASWQLVGWQQTGALLCVGRHPLSSPIRPTCSAHLILPSLAIDTKFICVQTASQALRTLCLLRPVIFPNVRWAADLCLCGEKETPCVYRNAFFSKDYFLLKIQFRVKTLKISRRNIWENYCNSWRLKQQYQLTLVII